MPNNITNRLEILGTENEINEVKNFIKDDKLGIGSMDIDNYIESVLFRRRLNAIKNRGGI